MKPIFRPADFIDAFNQDGRIIGPGFMAGYVNAKLEKLMADWPLVYGMKDADNRWHFDEMAEAEIDTHFARLAFIQEIKKEPCVHKPYIVNADGFHFGDMTYTSKCQHCGVELVAEWKEKK